MSLPPHLSAWAARHGLPSVAVAELSFLLGTGLDSTSPVADKGEAWVQSLVRLEAPKYDAILWRNNVGVLRDKTGRPVRYGLANDSPDVNAQFKSGDLIGVRRLVVTPTMVGSIVGQFISRECKHTGWRWPGDAHEKAQFNWLRLVSSYGGDARFTSGPEQW